MKIIERIRNRKSKTDNHHAKLISHPHYQEFHSLVLDSRLWCEKHYAAQCSYDKDKYETSIAHYFYEGASNGINGTPYFSESFYLDSNEDLKDCGLNPLYHYLKYGEKEGRKPNQIFCPMTYLELNPDLQGKEIQLLAHYVQYGVFEARKISNDEEKSVLVVKDTDSDLLTDFELAQLDFFEEKQIKSDGSLNTKVIAYYLPQFHPFEQNNKWWGKGFTEWTNVTKAKPLLKNHEHPRLPAELGFYDLRLKENIYEQARMARKSGVDAFCLYYYWFNGTVLMETPIETIYKNKDIDIEYCICWANENWTRAWDGLDKEVLIEQKYSPEDDIDFISHVSKYFADERYVKVDGKPLVIIYRPSNFPDMQATLNRWRDWSHNNGFGDLHITMVQFDDTDPNQYGFDAAVEFPPHKVASENVAPYMQFNPSFVGSVHDYSSMISNSLNKVDSGYHCYKAVTMAWDNTARRNDRASIFTNVTSGKLGSWLSGVEDIYNKNAVADFQKLVFVNAWNEWAEGTYLEPDSHHGFSYLNTVANFKSGVIRKPRIALLAHIFYSDLVDEIISYAKNIDHDFDILITCVSDSYQEVSKRFNEEFPNSLVDIRVVENRGRDIGPFLCNHVDSYKRYDYICKIHSKKSLHAGGIDNWRTFLYDRLLGSKEQVNNVIANFESDDKLGIQYPEYSDAIKPFISWGSNKDICVNFLDSLGLECPAELPDFPAGSMFWFRPIALRCVFSKIWISEDFPVEEGQIDETIMHAVERCLLLVAFKYNYLKLSI
ncbi:glycoside hydrolase family 99-like domain-containing protein [Enterovibrio norvegicus]|uniref:Glycoside hydrolase family 99-like domain-containing protein n=1 Tax=Enterovibrio norvegicus TaxID=188144 RepID=A0ABV4L6U2_9GAMM